MGGRPEARGMPEGKSASRLVAEPWEEMRERGTSPSPRGYTVVDILLAEKPLALSAKTGPVRAKVKWFNVEKGFGFIIPLNGEPEAFLHASVLARGGVARLGEGAEILCEIAATAKGPQVVRVDEVIAAEAARAPDFSLAGQVKWYQPDKGFGFVTAEDGDRDVFVHKSVLRRSGLNGLTAGQRVLVSVVIGPKGREARTVVVVPTGL